MVLRSQEVSMQQPMGLLPHELEYARNALVDVMVARKAATLAISEAAENGDTSEPGFFNPAVSAASQAAHVEDIRAALLSAIVEAGESSETMSYPNPDSPVVTFGSRVRLRELDGESLFDLTTRHIPGLKTDPDVEFVTPLSPMGVALIGRVQGDLIEWAVGNRHLYEAEIVAVDQVAQANSYNRPQ